MFGLLRVAFAALFLVLSPAAFAQNAGTVTNHALAVGKGPGVAGFTSVPLGSGQIAIGQTSADPSAVTPSGDVTINATGVTAIGATKVTSGMLNSSVFSTAHSWGGQQTFVAPILGTIASGDGSALTGTAAGFTAGHVTTNANLTGDVTSSGNATTLTNAPVIAKVLTGFTSGAGAITAADSILSAFQKLNGNEALKLPLAGGTMSGNIAMGGNAITGGGAITGTAITGTSFTGLPTATNAVQGTMEGDGSTISCVAGVCSSIGSAATAVTLGTTTATGGTAGNFMSITSSGCSSTTPCLTQSAAASKANQQAGTSAVVVVTPSQQQSHPSAAKAWAYVTFSGTTATIAAGYNVTSVVNTSTGNFTVTFTTAFASANYACVSTSNPTASNPAVATFPNQSAGSLTWRFTEAGSAANPASAQIICFGGQ